MWVRELPQVFEQTIIIIATCLEGFINQIDPVPLPAISPRARALHDTSFVADLHSDSLLFEIGRAHV